MSGQEKLVESWGVNNLHFLCLEGRYLPNQVYLLGNFISGLITILQ